MAQRPKASSARAPRSREDRAALIAARLAELRRERQLSQDAVAQLVGASQATVSRWEDPTALSTPSALEIAELAAHFAVEVGWLAGIDDHRDRLPEGEVIVDQALLDAFAAARGAAELKALLSREMTFGTVWVQIPPRAEVVSMHEALRRVKLVDRRVREVHPELWQEWARLVLS